MSDEAHDSKGVRRVEPTTTEAAEKTYGAQHFCDDDCLRDHVTTPEQRAAYDDPNEEWMCPGCGVNHGEPCGHCEKRGFHAATCPANEENVAAVDDAAIEKMLLTALDTTIDDLLEEFPSITSFHATSFESEELLTKDRGVVIKIDLEDGSEQHFQISIVRSR